MNISFITVLMSLGGCVCQDLVRRLIEVNFNGTNELCIHCKDQKIVNQIYKSRQPVRQIGLNQLQTTCDVYLICESVEQFETSIHFFEPHIPILFFPSNNQTVHSKKAFEKGLNLMVLQPDLKNGYKITYVLKNKTGKLNEEKLRLGSQKWNPRSFLRYTGCNISIGVFDCPPFVEVFGWNKLSGIEFDFISDFTRRWPIDYRILRSPNDNLLQNNYVNLFNKLALGQIDIAVCALWQRQATAFNMDYSVAMYPTCFTFLVHKPILLEEQTFLFHPFKVSAWVVIFASLVLLFAVYKLIEARSRNFGAQISQRTFALTACFSLALIFYYHSAVITILLNFPRFSHEFVNSLEDMIKYDVQWEEPLDNNQQFLINTGDATCMAIASNFKVNTNKALVNKRLRTRKYAFLVQVTAKLAVMSTEILDDYGRTHFRLLDECLGIFYTTVTFPKNSPFSKIFDERIYRYSENGLLQYWEEKTLRKPAYRYMKMFNNFYVNEMIYQRIDLEKLTGLFYLLFIGYAVSILCCVLEVISTKF